MCFHNRIVPILARTQQATRLRAMSPKPWPVAWAEPNSPYTPRPQSAISTTTQSHLASSPGMNSRIGPLTGRRMQTALPPVLIQGETDTGKTTIAVRPSVLIAEVRELERHREVLRPHGGDHRLQVVPALAGHTDMLFLNLRRHLEL